VVTGSAVALVVSSGAPQVATPNVVGLTEAAATSAITGADLTVGAVTTAPSTTVPAGSVISQTPTAGTQLETGSAVALVVSSGLPKVTTPNVVGFDQFAAMDEITNAGLSVGTVTFASSAIFPAGSVIGQAPVAGTQVTTGAAVSLVVSSGPPLISVPDVVGLTQTQAASAITGSGLSVGTVILTSSATVPAGSVISQAPEGGTPVTAGTDVELEVSSGPAAAVLAVDRVVFSDGAGTETVTLTTATAGELLVAFVASEGNVGQTVTVSGAGLTWTLVRRANAIEGTSEVWSAVAPARLINATITATQSVSSGMNQSLTVVAFTGAGGIGASVGNSGSRTAPSVVLTTTRAGSFVYGVGNDPIRRAARTLGANQSIVHQWVDTDSNQTFWVQARNGLVPLAGTGVNINSTSVNGDWNLVAVEILGR